MRQPLRFGATRATSFSLVAHALLLALLIAAGAGLGPPAPAPAIVEGVMLTAFAPPPAAVAERAAEPATLPPPVDPAAATATSPPPSPPAAREPPVAPRPASEAPSPRRAADAPQSAPPAPADTAIAQAPPAETSPVTETRSDVSEAADAEPSPLQTALAADPTPPASDSEPAAAAPPPTPLATTERQMLTKRLASWTGQFGADAPEPTLKWREDGRQYTAVLRRQPATDAMGMDHATVEVTTERDGNRMVTELRMTRVAFSNFAQFVDRWDPNVAIHDDEIDGRFHSNSEIHVSGGPGVKPVFRGKVTLAARDVETDNGLLGAPGFINRRTMFPAGIETMVRRISLAPKLPPDASDGDSQRFERDTAIAFYPDGTYGWRSLDGSGPEQRRPLTDRPHYLIGTDDNVTLEVHGTVSGTALVYTPGRIVIVRDLTYAHDPRMPEAGDYLGLVAERSVEIAEPKITGTGDLEVYASIYARGKFAVRGYLSKPAGRLTIYGSLAAGSMTATEPRYATSVRFDPRLATMRAPGFPLSDRYELESTSGEWRRVSPPPTAP
jgi:hypothetical protein